MKKGDRGAATLGKPEGPPGAWLDWGQKGFTGWQRQVTSAFVEAVLVDERFPRLRAEARAAGDVARLALYGGAPLP